MRKIVLYLSIIATSILLAGCVNSIGRWWEVGAIQRRY